MGKTVNSDNGTLGLSNSFDDVGADKAKKEYAIQCG